MKTLVKRTTPRLNGLPSIFDNLFLTEEFGRKTASSNLPAVNIQEHENAFTLSLALPGYQKEDLSINVEHELLTISSEKESHTSENEENFTRKEFSFASFSRSFTLPEIVDIENIEASSKDGILTVSLPKKEELVKNKRKSVAIK